MIKRGGESSGGWWAIGACLMMLLSAGCSTQQPAPPLKVVDAVALSQAGVESSNWLMCSGCAGPTAKTPETPVEPVRVAVLPRVFAKPAEPAITLPAEQDFYGAFFELGKANLSTDGTAQLLLAVPKAKNARIVGVAGRTDPSGPQKLNDKLATARAQAAATLLIKNGVPKEVIKVVTEAPAKTALPKALEADAPVDENARKRRVDVVVLPRNAP
jgi:outer membrane protein OmpA-like peptidoglycan-associated protein